MTIYIERDILSSAKKQFHLKQDNPSLTKIAFVSQSDTSEKTNIFFKWQLKR